MANAIGTTYLRVQAGAVTRHAQSDSDRGLVPEDMPRPAVTGRR